MDFALVVMGTSLGGLSALERILSDLPGEFPLPLAVVQHRSVESGEAMLHILRAYSALPIREPNDKEPIRPGYVYIAPADYHLLIEAEAFALTTEAPVYYARPSIDVLFDSAADCYAERVIGVVLTGASGDGARGAAHIKAQGGTVIVQDPASAECPVMPRAAIASTQVDYIVPLAGVAPLLLSLSALNASVPRSGHGNSVTRP